MTQFLRYLLLFCSFCLAIQTAAPAIARNPLSAEDFLRAIEPFPSSSDIYDYLDIYETDFTMCKSIPAYVRALTYLMQNGDIGVVNKRLFSIAHCPLTPNEQTLVNNLKQQATLSATVLAETTSQSKPTQQTTVTTQPQQAPITLRSPTEIPQNTGISVAAASQKPDDPLPPKSQIKPANIKQKSVSSLPQDIPHKKHIAAVPHKKKYKTTATPPRTSSPYSAIFVARSVDITGDNPHSPVLLPPPQPDPPDPPGASLALQQHNAPQAQGITLYAEQKTKHDTQPTAKNKKSRAKNEKKQPNLRTYDKQLVASNTPQAIALTPSQLPPLPAVQSSLNQPQPVARLSLQPRETQGTTKHSAPWQISFNTENTWRTGDPGTSRLFRTENTTAMKKGPWSVAMTTTHLNSDDYNGKAQVGSPKRTPVGSLLTEATVVTPTLTYSDATWEITAGSSPLGGEVNPLPTGSIQWKGENLTLKAFHASVNDSLLSHIGFTDIHSGKKMGRVMKTGARVTWADTFASDWFYGGTVTGTYMYGKNVKDNKGIKAEAYVGKTIGKFATGVYSSVDHFSHNLNYFTYGHGGYYSPQAAISAVSFVSFNHQTEKGHFKADISAGYLYEKNNASTAYPGNSQVTWKYEGSSKQTAVVSTGIEAGISLSEQFDLVGSARLLHTRGFTESRIGLNLVYEF